MGQASGHVPVMLDEVAALLGPALARDGAVLLDATLGFINLAQNDIIKLFSVLAVIFMPPTMIASIYGMNFKVMPELEWPWGYPAALVLMVLVAVGPYVFFRWKKWL